MIRDSAVYVFAFFQSLRTFGLCSAGKGISLHAVLLLRLACGGGDVHCPHGGDVPLSASCRDAERLSENN